MLLKAVPRLPTKLRRPDCLSHDTGQTEAAESTCVIEVFTLPPPVNRRRQTRSNSGAPGKHLPGLGCDD